MGIVQGKVILAPALCQSVGCDRVRALSSQRVTKRMFRMRGEILPERKAADSVILFFLYSIIFKCVSDTIGCSS